MNIANGLKKFLHVVASTLIHSIYQLFSDTLNFSETFFFGLIHFLCRIIEKVLFND